jgi:hypothetical protein
MALTGRGWAWPAYPASRRLLRASPRVTAGTLRLLYLRGEVVRETLSIMRECLLVLPFASSVAHRRAVFRAGPIGTGALLEDGRQRCPSPQEVGARTRTWALSRQFAQI